MYYRISEDSENPSTMKYLRQRTWDTANSIHIKTSTIKISTIKISTSPHSTPAHQRNKDSFLTINTTWVTKGRLSKYPPIISTKPPDPTRQHLLHRIRHDLGNTKQAKDPRPQLPSHGTVQKQIIHTLSMSFIYEAPLKNNYTPLTYIISCQNPPQNHRP